jgi:hypothetical protein
VSPPCRLSVLLALFALLIAPAAAPAEPGDGTDAFCDGRGPTPFELRVSEAQQFRAGLGLPSDRSYVAHVLRDRRYRGSRSELGQALTEPERLYVRDHRALEDKADEVDRYIRQTAGEDFVHLRIKNDFPTGAYILIRVHKDAERYARELSSFGLRIRVVADVFSEQELKVVQKRIQPEHAKLDAEGIRLTDWGSSSEENRVMVNLISARPDAIAVVEQLFGPAVRATLIATTLARNVCRSADGYSVGPSGRTLRVFWRTNTAAELVRVKVRQATRHLRIGVIERISNGPVTAAAKCVEVFVKLKKPLGSRAVVDGETGQRLRQRKRPYLCYRSRRERRHQPASNR